MKSLPTDAIPMTFCLTIPPAPDYASALTILWDAWKRVGTHRSRQKTKGKGELAGIYRGFAAAHYLNDAGQWGPHLHGVMMVASGFLHNSLGDLWNELTYGRAYIAISETVIGSVNYAIGGMVPSDEAGKKRLAELVRGEHQIRAIGR